MPQSKKLNDYNFKDGFVLLKDSAVKAVNGKTIQVKKNTKVFFTYPCEIFLGKEIGETRNDYYAKISFKGFSNRPKGYVKISHVKKPDVSLQGRIISGNLSQYVAAKHLEKIAETRKKKFKLISISDIGSNDPDIIAKYGRSKLQFEIKNVHNETAPITLFDKSISRDKEIPADLNYLARLFVMMSRDLHNKIEMKKYKFDFMGILDYIKDHMEPDSGMAEDAHTVKSGKMPKFFKTTDEVILLVVRKFIVDTLISNGNSYLGVFNKRTNGVKFFHTGLKDNILNEGAIPPLSKIYLTTYGNNSNSSTRIALKVKFKYDEGTLNI